METYDQILQSARGLFPLITCFDPPSDQKDNHDPIAILDLFVKNFESSDTLNQALAALKSTKPEFDKPPHVKWFAEYGCALLQSVQTVGIVTLMLVCLDEWKFEMQGGQKRTHSSSSNQNVNQSLYVGNVQTAEYDKFWQIYETLFTEAKSRKGDKRSAASNEQGNQKTPALIKAVLLDALSELVKKSDSLTPARGGFTDVGLHTGGFSRNTAQPLVQAVLQIMLESQGNQNLYYVVIAHLKLMCVEKMLKLAKQDNKNLDTVMQMLKATVNDGQNLTAPCFQFDIRDFETKCTNIRSSIDLIIQERTKTRAQIFMLPKWYDETFYRDPIIQIQSQETPPNVTMDINQAKKTAISNIGWLPAPLIFKNWLQLSQWLTKPELKQKTNNCMLLVMNTVEKFAYDKAQKFEFQEHLPELQQVKVVVELYLLTVASFLEKKPMFALLTVEIRSRETLVVWIAASIARFVTAKYDPIQIITEYKSALNWKDLRHLVLSEKLAVDAAKYIAAYLRKTDNAASKSNIFQLQSQDKTMDFAEHYAKLSSTIYQTWQKEKTEAANAQQTYWDQILKQQALLVKMDKELIDLQQMQNIWQTKFNQTEHPCNDQINSFGRKIQCATSKENNDRYNEANRNVTSYSSKINNKEQEIKRTEVPPVGIVQPLPKMENQALKVLFFMYMPENYNVLSNLMLLAQQMLLPKSDSVSIPDIGPVASFQKINVKEIIKVEDPKTVWRSHYSSHKRTNLQQVVDPQVVLGSLQEVINGKFWPSNVRNYKKPEQGVWHPDQFDKQLYWCGSDSKSSNIQNGKNINPFALIKNQVFVNTFTEMLPPEDQFMQWAMEQHGNLSQNNRQNWPEAVQDRIIKGKTQYLAFGTLRAYPNQQLRKLCVALRDRTLQLDTQLVHTLLRQTFYHLGDFSDEDLPKSLWWTDFEIQNDGRATFCNELRQKCEELQCMPRMHMAILILGELAAITSQWDPEARDIARRYAKIAINWAENLDSEIQSADVDKVSELRARRAIFSMYALVCHSAGDLTEDDVYKILKLVMIIENSRLAQEITSYDNQIRFLTVVTENVMARRLPAILILLDKHSEILTASSKLILEQTPSNLLWIRIQAPDGSVTQCYEAVSLTNDLYSLNVQTGVLLFNGLPPRRLPASMLALSLYKRSFGDRNFEVVVTMDNIFKTTRRVMNASGNGYFYEFFVDKNGKLVVREIDEKRLTLELLDGTEEWASDLPI